jgi:hypothetical protein
MVVGDFGARGWCEFEKVVRSATESDAEFFDMCGSEGFGFFINNVRGDIWTEPVFHQETDGFVDETLFEKAVEVESKHILKEFRFVDV